MGTVVSSKVRDSPLNSSSSKDINNISVPLMAALAVWKLSIFSKRMFLNGKKFFWPSLWPDDHIYLFFFYLPANL